MRGKYFLLYHPVHLSDTFHDDTYQVVHNQFSTVWLVKTGNGGEKILTNDDYRCIISDVLGPPLSSDIEVLYPDEVYPIGISFQIAHGLEYLHGCCVVHGGNLALPVA